MCPGALKAATKSQEHDESRNGGANPSRRGSTKPRIEIPGTHQNGKQTETTTKPNGTDAQKQVTWRNGGMKRSPSVIGACKPCLLSPTTRPSPSSEPDNSGTRKDATARTRH
jgi:hypothetical protein